MSEATSTPWRKKAGLAGVACLALACLAWGRLQLDAQRRPPAEQMKEVFLLPPGEVIRRADLGYHSLAADLLFIRANLYYGQHLYTDEQLPWLASFIDVLLTVDPDFKKAYIWGAMATTYYKREIDFVPQELVQRANRILERGMQRFPDDYVFPMRIAYNYYYEMGRAKESIPYFDRASRQPGAPSWLKRKATDLYTKNGDFKLAEQIVTSILAETDDEQLSDSMYGRIDLLMDPSKRDDLLTKRRNLLQSWRERYSFLPLDLYLLVREQ